MSIARQIPFYDYRNRAYSPDLGRFLQTDPIRFNAGDVNLYRYVGNNAVNFVDPMGLQFGSPGTAGPDMNGDLVRELWGFSEEEWDEKKKEDQEMLDECEEVIRDNLINPWGKFKRLFKWLRRS